MKNQPVIYSIILSVVAILIVIWGLLGVLDVKNHTYSGIRTDSNHKITGVDEGSPADIAGMKVGDVIIKSGGILVTDTEALSERARAKVGEVREFVVERDGESVTLQMTFAPIKNKNKAHHYLYFFMCLCFVIPGLYAHSRVRSNLSLIFAIFAVGFAYFFSFAYPLGPHVGNELFGKIVNGISGIFVLISLTVLIHFLFKYPPESNFTKKMNNKIWLYVPAIVIIVFALIFALFIPDKESFANQILGLLFILYIVVYLIWSLVILILKFGKTNPEERKTSGIDLLLWGGCIGIGSFFVSTIISFITSDSTLSGSFYVILLIIAIPVFFMLAMLRQNKNLLSKSE